MDCPRVASLTKVDDIPPMEFPLLAPSHGTNYRIQVEVPDEPGPWPVMLFLDGDDMFEAAVTACGRLRAAQEVPPVLIVGVGYGASFREPGNRRGRDYTPTHADEEPSSGGADGFLSFLIDVLWPELRQRWPVRDDARGIGGHSVGALFVLHALFQRRPFFQHHLASAPSIWWDNRAIMCHARQLREQQASLPASLFLSVGGKDSESMRTDLELMMDDLTARPFADLVLVRQDFPLRTHYDLMPDSFAAGMRMFFGAGSSSRG